MMVPFLDVLQGIKLLGLNAALVQGDDGNDDDDGDNETMAIMAPQLDWFSIQHSAYIIALSRKKYDTLTMFD